MTRTRRSTDGAGASVSNILEFGRDFPTAGGGPTPSYPLVVNRRSDARILATANHLAEELYAARPELLPLQPTTDADTGEVRAIVHDTYDQELAWLADEVTAAHAATAWREIGVLTRDNAHAADVFDALTAREIPVEIVGLKGLLRLPEVSEVVATLTLIQDVTDNAALLTLLAGPRWAIGPRDLALLGRRAEQLAGRRRGARDDARSRRRAAGRRRRCRPGRDRLARRRTRGSRRPRLLARGPRSGSRSWQLSCVACAAPSASPSSTWSDGSSTRPASTWSWHRRSALLRQPGGTTWTCSCRQWRSSRRSTAR